MNSLKSVDWNCGPRSVVITDGHPKNEIQFFSIALATDSAVVDWRGIATGHLENLSIIVRMY